MIISDLKKKIESKRGSQSRISSAIIRLKDFQWSVRNKILPHMLDRAAYHTLLPFYAADLIEQITPYAAMGFEDKIRLGKTSDGGYIIPKNILPLVEAVYTYGVGGDVSFEEDLVKQVPVPVRLYDHTVDAVPTYNKHFSFRKQGIAEQKHGTFETFSNHVAENGDTDKKILLKMDIEGYEWNVISGIIDTAHQNIVAIILETHEFDRYAYVPEYVRILKEINSRFTLVHIHGNNMLGTVNISGKKVPILCELTLINNRLVSRKKRLEESLPSLIDYPNQPHWKEIPLDFWLK